MVIRYDPLGKFHRAAGMGDVATVEHFTSLGYHVDEYDKRDR